MDTSWLYQSKSTTPDQAVAAIPSGSEDRPMRAPLYAFHDFAEMIGFRQVWDFEKKYADLLAIEAAG
jgi:hypothetical protein